MRKILPYLCGIVALICIAYERDTAAIIFLLNMWALLIIDEIHTNRVLSGSRHRWIRYDLDIVEAKLRDYHNANRKPIIKL